MSKGMRARAFWIEGPGQGKILEKDLPPGQGGEVRVRTLYSGISRGTEALIFRGEIPPSQHAVMRCPFQEGEFPGPVKYGYMSVGRIEGMEAPPPGAEDLLGREVFCLHPHQDLYNVPVEAVFPLPPKLPPERAVLAANLETAVNVSWDLAPGVGDRIVVVGAGVVGLLTAWLCARIPGVELRVVDVDPRRAGPARELGLDFSTDPPGWGDADGVVHASGTEEGLESALGEAGPEGVVVEASWHGDRSVSVPLGEGFHSRRLTLKSSQVGRIPPSRLPRWSHRRRLTLALELLRDPVLDVLISGESPFEELPRVLTRIAEDSGFALCHRIRYPSVGV
jgi:threonine dehydrogenase-like Zn-dependent dehydrogenase